MSRTHLFKLKWLKVWRSLQWGWSLDGGILGTRICWVWSTFLPWSSEGCIPACVHRTKLRTVYASFLHADIVSQWSSFCQPTNRQYLLHQPFARTNAFHNSLVPRTVNIWNSSLRHLWCPPSTFSDRTLCNIIICLFMLWFPVVSFFLF